MTPSFVIQRGETLTLVVEALAGVVADVSGVTAKMKQVQIGRHTVMPGPEVAVAASFTVSVLPAATGFLGGWSFTLNSAQTAALAAGLYLLDASFTVAGSTVIDGPHLLEVKNSAVAA